MGALGGFLLQTLLLSGLALALDRLALLFGGSGGGRLMLLLSGSGCGQLTLLLGGGCGGRLALLLGGGTVHFGLLGLASKVISRFFSSDPFRLFVCRSGSGLEQLLLQLGDQLIVFLLGLLHLIGKFFSSSLVFGIVLHLLGLIQLLRLALHLLLSLLQSGRLLFLGEPHLLLQLPVGFLRILLQ